MKPIISVIVPVYQVEAYLTHCLDSLCRQSLPDIELILVDDASPDRCGAICEEYATRDPRIRVFHQPENRGLSAARNLAIRNAAGDYLMFVDSDDWVHEDFCKAAYECAQEHHADLVMFNYVHVRMGEKGDASQRKAFRSFTEGCKTKEESLDMMLADGGNAAWNKLYRKELFKDVTYPEGFLYEDTGATYKLMFKATRFYFLDQVLYYQNIRPDSITTSKVTQKVLDDRATQNIQRYRDLTSWGFRSEMLEYRFLNFALWYCMHQKRDMSNPDYIYLSRALRSCRQVPQAFTSKKRYALWLFKHCPWLIDLFYTIKGREVI